MVTRSTLVPFFEPNWGSVIRIGFWCLLFLWLFGKAVPPLPERIPLQSATASALVPMLTIFDDHRTVRDDYRPDSKKLHIAWISDSSGVVSPQDVKLSQMSASDYDLIPSHVAADLQKRHALRDFDMPLYLRLGSRPLDNLVFALRALQDKPDLIVMNVNPVWTFGHYQIMNQSTSLNLAPSVWATMPSLWYMIPLFCSPAENLWALVGRHVDILREALPFKDYLEQKYEASLKALGVYAGPAPLVLGVPLLGIKFWIVENILHGDASGVLDKTGKLNAMLYDVQLIRRSAPGDDRSFATIAFHDLLDALKASGVPVLIYAHPVSDFFYDNPDTNTKIKAMQDFLAQTNDRLKGSRIRIISSIPEPVRKSIAFRKNDGYHAAIDPTKFDDYLADQIWLMLRDSGKLSPPEAKKP